MSESQAEMPRYKCHKEVHALKIKAVRQVSDPKNFNMQLVPEDERYAPVEVDQAWYAKHNPQAEGYYVVYADGYTSFSPASAFEEGYTKI